MAKRGTKIKGTVYTTLKYTVTGLDERRIS